MKDKELSELINSILEDFSIDELENKPFMISELQALLGVSEAEAAEILVLARFQKKLSNSVTSSSEKLKSTNPQIN
ncbi:MAG: hypothetical protein KDD56_00050 [Bdellovibrionales bacterium]|nr:hypothetical protein [Bdellovibrionales bacterium]